MWHSRNTGGKHWTRRAGHGAHAAALAVGLIVLGGACAPEAPEGDIPTHPGDRFSVTLEWYAPETDAVGQPLLDLAGYRLYYSTESPATGPGTTLLDVGDVTRYTAGDLAPGTYFFAVTAYDADGNESLPSGELQVEVGAG